MRVNPEFLRQSLFEKTKPIDSYWVLRKESQGLRDAYCEKEFEKTKPIFWEAKLCKIIINNSLWRFWWAEAARKQSQFKANRRPLAGKSKH